MAMLLNIRMIQQIATWDSQLHDQINSGVAGRFEEEPEMPLPMLVL
jgi:hypothetical protein